MVATSERKRIAHKLPPVGSTLTHKYRGQPYTAKIVRVNGRAVKYGNRIFFSPSAAAKAVTGCDINGWTFWHLAETSGRRPHPRRSN